MLGIVFDISFYCYKNLTALTEIHCENALCVAGFIVVILWQKCGENASHYGCHDTKCAKNMCPLQFPLHFYTCSINTTFLMFYSNFRLPKMPENEFYNFVLILLPRAPTVIWSFIHKCTYGQMYRCKYPHTLPPPISIPKYPPYLVQVRLGNDQKMTSLPPHVGPSRQTSFEHFLCRSCICWGRTISFKIKIQYIRCYIHRNAHPFTNYFTCYCSGCADEKCLSILSKRKQGFLSPLA